MFSRKLSYIWIDLYSIIVIWFAILYNTSFALQGLNHVLFELDSNLQHHRVSKALCSRGSGLQMVETLLGLHLYMLTTTFSHKPQCIMLINWYIHKPSFQIIPSRPSNFRMLWGSGFVVECIYFSLLCHYFRRCHWHYSDNSCNTDHEIADWWLVSVVRKKDPRRSLQLNQVSMWGPTT